MEAPLTPQEAQAAQQAANIRTLKEQAYNLSGNLRKIADRIDASAEQVELAPDAYAKVLRKVAQTIGGGELALKALEEELTKRAGG